MNLTKKPHWFYFLLALGIDLFTLAILEQVNPKNSQSIVILTLFIIGFIILIFFQKMASLKTSYFKTKDFLFGIIGLTIWQYGIGFIKHYFHLGISSNQQYFEQTLHQINPIYLFFYVVLLSPIMEEYLFRGLIFLKAFNGTWIGLALSGLAFGIAHTPTNFLDLMLYVGSGLILGYITSKTEHLETSVAIHATNNLIAYCWLFL